MVTGDPFLRYVCTRPPFFMQAGTGDVLSSVCAILELLTRRRIVNEES